MDANGLILIFLAGWGSGIFLEWVLHWIMHRFALGFHLHHHREFFHLEPRRVALNTIDPRLDIWFFLGALVLASPLMFWVGWAPVLAFWAGNFWQVVIVYELCHALIHHDVWVPRLVTSSWPYRWWKGCHFEHHFHTPAKNFSVTCPWLDWLFGTYAAPRKQYETLPHPKLKPLGNEYVVPADASAVKSETVQNKEPAHRTSMTS